MTIVSRSPWLAASLMLLVAPLGAAMAQTQRPTPAAVDSKAAPAAPAPKAAASDAKPASNSPLAGFGGNSKEPYKIDADRLEVQQKDNKAIYSGDVVVVQGKTTMRCSSLVIFFEQKKDDAKKQAAQPANLNRAQPAAAPGQPGASGLKRLECHGPVSVTQEKQSATSKLLVYEADVVTLTGDVIMADGDNVQAGEKMVYNTKTGVGSMSGGVEPGKKEGGRVRGIFLPGSGDKDPNKKAEKKDKTG